MAYIGKSPTNGVRSRFVYQATASQTTFSGSDSNSLTFIFLKFKDIIITAPTTTAPIASKV